MSVIFDNKERHNKMWGDIFLLIFIVLPLQSACSRGTLNYQYYMENPTSIEDAYRQCRQQFSATEPLSEQCRVVVRAERDYRTLATEALMDAQSFGQKILTAQMHFAMLGVSLEKNQEALKDTHLKNHQRDQLVSEQQAITVNIQTKLNELNTYLAVIRQVDE